MVGYGQGDQFESLLHSFNRSNDKLINIYAIQAIVFVYGIFWAYQRNKIKHANVFFLDFFTLLNTDNIKIENNSHNRTKGGAFLLALVKFLISIKKSLTFF